MAHDPSYLPPVTPQSVLDNAGQSDAPPEPAPLFAAERAYVNARRQSAEVHRQDADAIAALAISGGGIRSATFALGLVQALSRANLLRQFDYLSTVSGGGYLGTALQWWWSGRAGNSRPFGLAPGNFPYGVDAPHGTELPQDAPDQQQSLRFLRQRGEYLTPGTFSLAAGVGAVLRGVVLNVTVLLVALVTLLITAEVIATHTIGRSAWVWEVYCGTIDQLEPDATPPDSSPNYTVVPEGGTYVVLPGTPPGWEKSALRKRLAAEQKRKIAPACLEKPPVPVLYAVMVVAAVALAGFFVLLAFLYAVVSKVASHKSIDYLWRRWMDKIAGNSLLFIVVALVGGTLPFVYQHTFDWMKILLPALGGGAGIAAALLKFVRGEGTGSVLDKTWVVVGGAVLLLYAMLWSAYGLLRWVIPLAGAPGATYAWLYGVAAVALLFSWAVNINHLTLHRYYRDRLLEAFLPEWSAVRGARTAASVGGDDVPLQDMANLAAGAPYPLINTNVVLVDSDDLTWSERGGDSYVLSPYYCGSGATGWRRTGEILGGTLSAATAMATSGAAANPDAVGVQRNRLVALLMSILNLRLGLWLPHPARRRQNARPNHLIPGLAQVFHWGGMGYREHGPFVQISDGGHFENLALYELIRRKARLIVLSDGAADPDFHFDDFTQFCRRVAIDFGAVIDVRSNGGLSHVVPNAAATFPWPGNPRQAPGAWLEARVRYADGSEGALIYVKATLVDGLPPEVLGYANAEENKDFPHQTTADQWFDEQQFEAYRQLGHFLGTRMIAEAQLAQRLAAL